MVFRIYHCHDRPWCRFVGRIWALGEVLRQGSLLPLEVSQGPYSFGLLLPLRIYVSVYLVRPFFKERGGKKGPC